jgi:hypothetical protein
MFILARNAGFRLLVWYYEQCLGSRLNVVVKVQFFPAAFIKEMMFLRARSSTLLFGNTTQNCNQNFNSYKPSFILRNDLSLLSIVARSTRKRPHR